MMTFRKILIIIIVSGIPFWADNNCGGGGKMMTPSCQKYIRSEGRCCVSNGKTRSARLFELGWSSQNIHLKKISDERERSFTFFLQPGEGGHSTSSVLNEPQFRPITSNLYEQIGQDRGCCSCHLHWSKLR